MSIIFLILLSDIWHDSLNFKSSKLAAFEKIVEKYGVIACVSAGNEGPGLNTVILE